MKSPNSISCVVFLFFLTYCGISKPILASKDLTITYDTANSRIKELRSQISSLPQVTKQALNPKIKNASDVIEQIYSDAVIKITPLEKKKKNISAAQKVDIIVNNAQGQINQKMNDIELQVSSAAYKNKQDIGQQETEQNLAKQSKLTKAKAAYERKMEQLFIKIQGVVPAYTKALQAVQNSMLSMYGKPYDAQKVEDITQQLSTVAQQAYTVYKDIGPTKADDKFNVLVTILKKLSDIYNNFIFYELNKLSTRKSDDTYFKILSDLSNRMLGTNKGSGNSVVQVGYDETFKKLVEKYFTDSVEKAKMLNYYLSRKIQNTYTFYTNALQALIAQASNPTDIQRQYALAIYNLIISDLMVVSEKERVAPTINVNLYMATLYVASAQALIKSMQMNKDTTAVVTKLIEFYKQAAYYFSQAQDARASLYTKLYKFLEQARTDLKQAQAAQQAGNNEVAIQAYKNAQKEFLQGGDVIDSTKIIILLADLEGKYLIDTTKNSFKQFFSQNKTLIEEYLTYIDTLDSSITMNTFDGMFSSLIKIFQTAYANYAQALTGYQAVPIKNQSIDSIQNLQMAVSLVNTLSQAQADLQAGDRILTSKTAQSLQEAKRYYTNAIALSQLIDGDYAKNPGINEYVPRYFIREGQQKENYSFTLIAHRHNAKLDIVLANSMTDDLATALLYYNDANNQFVFLTKAVDDFLTFTLSTLSENKTTVDGIFQTAQGTEKILLTLSADSWAPKTSAAGYTSDATSKWHALLHQYLTVYHMGYFEAKNAYINAINEYAAQYKKNVPPAYYSDLDSALIKYHQYVIYINDNEQTEAAAVLKEIEEFIGTTFSAIQKLIDSVAQPASLMTTATIDQKKIIQWSAALDLAISQQEEVLSSVGQKLLEGQLQQTRILDRTVDSQGALTYTYLPTKKTITISNPLVKLASLYKQLADYFLSKKNYAYAYPYYYYAKDTYMKAQQTTLAKSFDDLLARADTLYMAAQYRDLVIPQGEVILESFKVPESYLIKIYGQTIPSEISDLPEFSNLDFLKNDNQKTQDFLINLATKMYIYNKVNDIFASSRFNELFPLVVLSYDQLQNNALFKTFSQDEQNAFMSLVINAKKFSNDLAKRIADKQSNLVLQQKSQQLFVLYEYNIFLPRFSDPLQFYQSYPSAIIYYYYAAEFFKTGKPGDTITVNQLVLPPGNDPEEYAKMITHQSNVYISQGHVYRQQIDDLKKGEEWSTLTSRSKTDMNITVSSFTPLYSTVKDSFNNMITYYNGPLANDFIAQKSPQANSLNTLLGASYKDLGDTLSFFLIGNPLSADYSLVLKDILKNYVAAIVNYNYDSKIYADIAKMYNASGDLLIAQQRYFDSLSFFYTANSLFQRVDPQNEQTRKWAEQAQLKYCEAMFKGSTDYIDQFENARKKPFEVTLSDGSKETISFNKLYEKYLGFKANTGGIDPAEKDKFEALQALVLDALIFYNGCYTIIKNGIGEPPIALLSTLVSDEKKLKNVEDEALSLLDTFTLRNNISLDSLDTVTLMLAQTNFPDGKDFAELILNGFELFKKKVEQSSDNFNKAVGYSAIAQFALKLYSAFGYIYQDIYFGGLDITDAQEQLAAAINAEVNAILAPAKQYIG